MRRTITDLLRTLIRTDLLRMLIRPWTRDVDVVALRHENRLNLLEKKLEKLEKAVTPETSDNSPT